jgi:hypothetical protein
MDLQRDLFRPLCATVRAHQAELFDRGGRVSDLSCQSCGEPMEYTPGGYIACPSGCGRLVEAVQADEDRSGLWFTDDDLTADDE